MVGLKRTDVSRRHLLNERIMTGSLERESCQGESETDAKSDACGRDNPMHREASRDGPGLSSLGHARTLRKALWRGQGCAKTLPKALGRSEV